MPDEQVRVRRENIVITAVALYKLNGQDSTPIRHVILVSVPIIRSINRLLDQQVTISS